MELTSHFSRYTTPKTPAGIPDPPVIQTRPALRRAQLTESLGQHFALEYPDLHADDAVGGLGEGRAVIYVGPIELSDYEESELAGGSPIGKFLAAAGAIEYLTHDLVGLKLALLEPARISFKAGQYVDVLVPGTTATRSYSMANPPSRAGEVELMVKLMPGGLFAGYLRDQLKAGDRLTLEGPYGSFHLREAARPALFIAGGSGMAPMLALLRDMAEKQDRRPVTFFYGARAKRDLFALDELFALERTLPAFRFVPALAEPAAEDLWAGAQGLITEVVAREVPDARGMEAYLCGPSAMIDAAIVVLMRLGVAEHDIYYDKFVTQAETPSSR